MYLKNEQMELTDFLHTDINWRILKGDRNFFGGWGWVLSKTSVASLVTGVYNWLYLKNEQIESTDFMLIVTDSQKLKANQIFFG